MEALGPVLLLLSIPPMLRWIPRNHLYGFRTASTLANHSVWYDANALSGRHTFVLGLVMVLLEFVLPVTVRTVVLRSIAIIGLGAIVVADWRTPNWRRRERESHLNPSRFRLQCGLRRRRRSGARSHHPGSEEAAR